MSRDARETAFHFGEDDLALQPDHVEVRIRPGVSTKKELLAALDTGLNFPEYFGSNWDALWECICDLSWLTPIQVVVVHEDLPLKEDPAQLQTYVSIVADAIKYWANRSGHELIIVFPAESKALVSTLVAAQESS